LLVVVLVAAVALVSIVVKGNVGSSKPRATSGAERFVAGEDPSATTAFIGDDRSLVSVNLETNKVGKRINIPGFDGAAPNPVASPNG
jgi:hypothetical protein